MMQPVLSGAIGPVDGKYFLLIDADEDDNSVLAVAERAGDFVDVRALSGAEEFISMDVVSGLEGAVVCALSADGKLNFSDGSESWQETVPRSGHRLRTVRCVDGTLYVTGFRGHVVRRGEGSWEEISFDDPELVGGHALFYHVVAGPTGAPVFGGVFVHLREVTEAMKAASAARDAKLFRKLARASRSPDHMLVAEYRDGWRVLFTGQPGIVSWLWPTDGGYFVVASTGQVCETEDFSVLDERAAAAGAFDDIKMYDGQPVFLRENVLSRLGPEGLVAFEPGLPPAADSIIGLRGGADSLIAIERAAIWALDSGGWTRLQLRSVPS